MIMLLVNNDIKERFDMWQLTMISSRVFTLMFIILSNSINHKPEMLIAYIMLIPIPCGMICMYIRAVRYYMYFDAAK